MGEKLMPARVHVDQAASTEGVDAAELRDFGDVTLTFQRFPDEEQGPWMLRLYWQQIDGRTECVGMKLSSMASPAENRAVPPHLQMPTVGVPLPLTLVRDLKLGEIIRAERERLDAGQVVAPAKPPSLRQSTWERLQEAATIYRAAYATSGKPTSAVADHFGLTVGGASNLVSRARELGLLPPTSRGASQG
ncbi:hypothetical protein GCM10010170_034570 [Dactylosporangium salmoneum]|uniref:Uncharacterized protein n=1 Tax=Dactylosporangium salmoneum TaxID=53361 RepID=A0ABP5TCQ1_9ACTN